jgi:hypothetical protein
VASEAQIAANRRNAENSTGPRTEEGKAKVARNALRHGLRAEKVVTFDETGGDFQAFLAEQRGALEPADAIEEQLVERIAFCAWRLRRIYRLEAHIIDSWHTPASLDEEDWGIEESLDANPYEISTLARYESAVDRALNRAYVMLERRQAKRRGEFVPAPLAIAVSGFRPAERSGGPAAKSEFFRTKPISAGELDGDAEPPSALAPKLEIVRAKPARR